MIAELLASDHRRTLEFFVIGLRDVSEPTVDTQELLYNASILAHYAQVSTAADDPIRAPRNLSDVFVNFVWNANLVNTPYRLETAGAQCLLLSGFFEDQQVKRHNTDWYARLGATYFRQAAKHEVSATKSALLMTMHDHFESWRKRHTRLSHELRDLRYILSTPPKAS